MELCDIIFVLIEYFTLPILMKFHREITMNLY